MNAWARIQLSAWRRRMNRLRLVVGVAPQMTVAAHAGACAGTSPRCRHQASAAKQRVTDTSQAQPASAHSPHTD